MTRRTRRRLMQNRKQNRKQNNISKKRHSKTKSKKHENKMTGGKVIRPMKMPPPDTPTCNPANKDKLSGVNTCFTPQVLLKIKEEYNKDHPQSRIETREAREIWQQLHDRLKSKSEMQWLDEIDDAGLREQVQEKIFAPEQPKEWRDDPDAWLSNYDIFNVLKQYEDAHADFKVLKPTSIDFDLRTDGGSQCVSNEYCKFSLNEHMKRGKRKFGFVFNLDKHTGPGTHWVSMYLDADNGYVFYFDSAGAKMPTEIGKLMDRIEAEYNATVPSKRLKKYTNGGNAHQSGNSECGMYSLFFIITMLTGTTPFHPEVMTPEERIQLFLKEKIPDDVVFDYRDLYFNPL